MLTFMAIKKDAYEEIAVGRCEKMPQGAHCSHCSVGQEPSEMQIESEVLISAWDSSILMSSNWQLALSLPELFQASKLQGAFTVRDTRGQHKTIVSTGDQLSKADGIGLGVQVLADLGGSNFIHWRQ